MLVACKLGRHKLPNPLIANLSTYMKAFILKIKWFTSILFIIFLQGHNVQFSKNLSKCSSKLVLANLSP